MFQQNRIYLPLVLLASFTATLGAKTVTSDVGYIRPSIPDITLKAYQGQRYQSKVPDTLDLAERSKLAIHAMTSVTDPKKDYEIYWLLGFNNPLRMYHDWQYVTIQPKFMEALPLLRIAGGSEENLQVDQRWLEVALHMSGPDGLIYTPAQGRPWVRKYDFLGLSSSDPQFAVPYQCGRMMGAMTANYSHDRNPIWKQYIERLVQRLNQLTVDKGDYAYFPLRVFVPGDSVAPDEPMPGGLVASCVGWVFGGLTQYYRISGYEPARELAGKLIHYLRLEQVGFYDAQGRYLDYGHFHHHTYPLIGMLDFAVATGDSELKEFVRKAYEFGKSEGMPLVGFFPESYNTQTKKHTETSETCEVADMIAVAIKLTQAKVGDYWDDADRWLRNQFAENQMLDCTWINEHASQLPESPVTDPSDLVDQVAERNIGAFAGWPSANDFCPNKGHIFMHCCLGNAARTLFFAWKNILDFNNGQLRVNLLLNRASPWADIHSHIPYVGQVDIQMKQSCSLSVRIPQWVTPEQAQCKVNNQSRSVRWDGRYAVIGSVQAADKIALTFPISERTVSATIGDVAYHLVIKGNEVVHIDPPGQVCPLYQRQPYRQNQTVWKTVDRFVSQEKINW